MPFDSPKQKGEALDNFAQFDVHRWSDYPEVNNAVDAVFDDLRQIPNFGGNERLKKKHIKVVVLDLYAKWLADPTRYTAYSRSRNDYRGRSRYNRLHISYLTVSVIDALRERGYVEHHIGFHDHEWQVGRRSRMRATDRLIELIRRQNAVPAEAIQRYPGVECLILRDIVNGRKVDIEYEDTFETKRMRAALNDYNALLAKTDISLPNAPPEGIPNAAETRFIKPDFTAKFVRRIFNNGSWEEGGRFYGGWWQRIPWQWRVQISVNGASDGSVEVDYSGHHIVLLYALEGADFRRINRRDPYRLPGFEQTERMRRLLKLVLLIIINARDRRSALSAIRRHINFDLDSFGWTKQENVSLEHVVDAFADWHKRIAKHFFSNAGIRLQNLDAQIAESVLNHFTQAGIPVLCIHDSFVMSPAQSEDLSGIMNQAIWEKTRNITDVKLDITPVLKKRTIRDLGDFGEVKRQPAPRSQGKPQGSNPAGGPLAQWSPRAEPGLRARPRKGPK